MTTTTGSQSGKARGPNAVAVKPTASKPGSCVASKGKLVAESPKSPDGPTAKTLATLATLPSANAAIVMASYCRPLNVGETEVGELMDVLLEGIEGMLAGNMDRAEAMLYAQAHALQAIFMNLARRAAKQDHMQHFEAFFRMALKAQNQARMTIETLALVKNPPVVFARQANINNGGQQQVNNGTRAEAPRVHAANQSTEKTGLLEASDGERVEPGATRTASKANPQLEAVGAVHRPTHR